jgi:hypothetical protein
LELDGRPIDSTRGWRSPELQGPDDFRQGYDTMTVVRVGEGPEGTIDMKRPYCHVYDGVVKTGVEDVNGLSRDHGGLWYELLGQA